MRNFSVKQLFVSFLTSCVLLISTLSYAMDVQPVMLLKQSTQQMLSMLKNNRAQLHNNTFLRTEVRKIVVPRFDLNTMARQVVGRSQWNGASEAQRQAFIHEFTDMVIGVYSAPLADYNGDQVQFFPNRDGASSRTVVRTQIIRPTGQKIAVVYQMQRVGNTWKVYDFSIEGVSMVSSYRAQFADVLQTKGLSGLLSKLQQHNRSTS